ncbi:guided entry of tail-anchored proteins factor CAMLG [Gadus morhua]|uniref:Calcium modulating ligand n=1 Tax=Gadus morhua TaxID=8049 RepID=A0A8C5A049_GADMO|nr:calcium signal-modulating cyclophilin ligand [Gadus morhua]XP_056449449.1 calcium signal-modulating cyclophilin ligand [Gadus chalcogrammus]
MESTEDNGQTSTEEKTLSAAQRRAEIRRRKLLMNSEDRMNRIVGYTKIEPESAGTPRRPAEPRFHLDLERTDPWPANSSPRPSPFLQESAHSRSSTPERRGSPLPDLGDPVGGSLEDLRGVAAGVRQRPRGERPSDDPSGSPRRGLQTYLSRFDDAMKLRGQLAVASEKAAEEGDSEPEEFDVFRMFRLIGSLLLAVFVRVSVCQYLSIFAPFLTLELAYMGLYKYFPKVERKPQSTVLTAALLLSGIPAEVINRSMDTYRRMGDVFADLCLYFFTFVLSHEILLIVGSETP